MSLAHRTLSSTNSTVPLKRKSDVDSEATSLSSSRSVKQPNGKSTANGNENDDYNDLFRSFKQRPPPRPAPYTPSPRGSETPGEFSVIIPSPSAQLKQEIASAKLITENELTGLSEEFYPTDAHERRASKGAYPAARKTDRSVVPFVIGKPGPFLTGGKKRSLIELLTESLKSKLASISGPAVTVTRQDEKLLADTTSGFEFVNEYKLREGVSSIAKEFQAGCTCKGVCDPSRCSCLAQEEDSNERIIPYERDPVNRQLLVLSPGFINRTSMIYECSELCDCGSKCWNSVIRNGRSIRLEIFHTGTRGFGMPPFVFSISKSSQSRPPLPRHHPPRPIHRPIPGRSDNNRKSRPAREARQLQKRPLVPLQPRLPRQRRHQLRRRRRQLRRRNPLHQPLLQPQLPHVCRLPHPRRRLPLRPRLLCPEGDQPRHRADVRL